jgi:hypothetical protein
MDDDSKDFVRVSNRGLSQRKTAVAPSPNASCFGTPRKFYSSNLNDCHKNENIFL